MSILEYSSLHISRVLVPDPYSRPGCLSSARQKKSRAERQETLFRIVSPSLVITSTIMLGSQGLKGPSAAAAIARQRMTAVSQSSRSVRSPTPGL